MKLSSFATNALATTRSTFKGLADAAVATGDNADPAATSTAAEKPAVAETSTEPKPKGVRLGTVLDAYA
jgi:hypothetical protein